MTRLTIAINDALVEQAREVLGTRTKKDTVDAALREVVRRARLAAIEKHCGTLDLGFSREDLLKQRVES